MSWFADLSPYRYLGYDLEEVQRAGGGVPPGPLLNIGWLSRKQLFSTGAASLVLVDRLRALVELAPTRKTRGYHLCEFCPGASWDDEERRSFAEIRAVGADGVRYAAPLLIVHYVTEHRYLPPDVFVDAVLREPRVPPAEAWGRGLCVVCASPLSETERDDAVRRTAGGELEPMVEVWYWCSTCGTDYDRAFSPQSAHATPPRESPCW